MLSQRNSRIVTSLTRTLCTTAKVSRNHYDVLEITPKATQGDIKSAYYKLSKIYHPDKSKSEESAKIFRAITEAYEVLGNVKLKKMYDKGLLTGRENSRRMDYHPEPEPVDPTLKFYKSRTVRHVTPTADGRPVYDFESWSKQHYGEMFQEKQYAKRYVKSKREKDEAMAKSYQEQLGLTIIMFIFLGLIYGTVFGDDSYDVDRTPRKAQNNSTNDNP